MPVTHSSVVIVPDDGTSPVGTDEWNATHAVTDVWEGGGRMTVSGSPPSDPAPGDIWIDTST